MTPTLLETQDLHISYGRVEAVCGVNLVVKAGQIVTIIGPNGAGKSTLLSGLMRLIPAKGSINFFGSRARIECEDLIARGATLIPERRDLFGTLTIEDNLLLGAFAWYRLGDRDQNRSLEDVFTLFPRLRERRRQKAATLSGGERQMLAIGRAVMSKPKLLLLDEPSLGLAPLVVRDIFKIIVNLRSLGVSCLLVEQNARAALSVSDYAYVMESGHFIMEGSAKDIANNPNVIDSYLGLRDSQATRSGA